jgi:ribosome recycling factor
MATLSEIIKEGEAKMVKSIDAARHEFSTLRTGRANPAILDGITVESYGASMPINEVAQILATDARQIVISPYDRSMLGPIEKAIKMSDLNINPINDGIGVRLNLPPLTNDRRKEMVKVLQRKAEDGKVAVRNIRRDANDQIKQLEKKSEVSKDEAKRSEDQLQKLTDKYIGQVEDLQKAKEAELMEV